MSGFLWSEKRQRTRATVTYFLDVDHFLLDKVPLFCYGTIRGGQWYAHSKRSTEVLWSRVYQRRGVFDPRGCRDLWRDQPDRACPYCMRIAGLEASQWRTEGPGVPGSAGAVGEPGGFDTSGQKVVRFEHIQEEDCARWGRASSQRAYGQRGGLYPLGCAVGRKPTTAATFQGACKPVSLSGIRNALRGAAPVFGLRNQAPAGSGRVRAVFESGMANEGPGSMDRLGRCDTKGSIAARGLASMLLSCALRQLRTDWHRQYGLEPWLVETLVDRQRFYGGCYRAANWTVLGETSGRGRMDRGHQRHGAQVKTVLVYPLVKNAVCRLRDGG